MNERKKSVCFALLLLSLQGTFSVKKPEIVSRFKALANHLGQGQAVSGIVHIARVQFRKLTVTTNPTLHPPHPPPTPPSTLPTLHPPNPSPLFPSHLNFRRSPGNLQINQIKYAKMFSSYFKNKCLFYCNRCRSIPGLFSFYVDFNFMLKRTSNVVFCCVDPRQSCVKSRIPLWQVAFRKNS